MTPRELAPKVLAFLAPFEGCYISIQNIAEELGVSDVLALAAADCCAINKKVDLYTALYCCCDPEGFSISETLIRDGWPELPKEPCHCCGQKVSQDRARYQLLVVLLEQNSQPQT